jgi:hypothetical protein
MPVAGNAEVAAGLRETAHGLKLLEDKMNDLRVSIAELSGKVDHHDRRDDDRFAEVARKVDCVRDEIRGDGGRPLPSRVDRLEEGQRELRGAVTAVAKAREAERKEKATRNWKLFLLFLTAVAAPVLLRLVEVFVLRAKGP